MNNPSIDPKEISVIVRGLIVGNDQTDERKKFTKRSLASVRAYLPEAQLILSTWKGADVSGLDYDDLVLSDPPASIYMALPDGTPRPTSANNQIVSTQNGLKKARGKYALVMRSDVVLVGAGFMKYFLAYNKNNDSDLLKKRVVVLPTYSPRGPVTLLFSVCDWFFFGLTDDVKNIFDIPLMDERAFRGETINGYYPRESNFEAEQYLWTSFLEKHRDIDFPYNYYYSEEARASSERSYAQNIIMVPAPRAGALCLKMPHAGYGARPILSHGLYTFNEYKEIYNRYNSRKIFYIPNPIERLSYSLLLRSRLFMKKASPTFYKKAINFIRRRNGSNDLLK